MIDTLLTTEVSWKNGAIREEYVDHYLTLVAEMEDDRVTTATKLIMTGTGPTGKRETLLFDQFGCLGKTTRTPMALLNQFQLRHQGMTQEKWRQSLNFAFRKMPKLAAFVTPDTCFSRVTEDTWVNLDGVQEYYASKVEGLETCLTFIAFSFGGSLELQKGIKSVRQTLWTDTHEFWSIQLSNLFGAIPLYGANGFANPSNPLMANKFKLAGIDLLIINQLWFLEVIQVMTDLIDLYYAHVLSEPDYILLPPSKRQILRDILKWKEGGNNGK